MLIDPAQKIMTLEQAIPWREQLRITGKRLVVTNGCFDILHRGHAQYLWESRNFGSALAVLINSDASVQELKGPERPIIDEFNRAYMLAALESVDCVIVFNQAVCAAELAALAPDVYVKGGDYTIDKLNKEERAVLENAGAEFRFIPFVEGFSSTTIISKIKLAGSC